MSGHSSKWDKGGKVCTASLDVRRREVFEEGLLGSHAVQDVEVLVICLVDDEGGDGIPHLPPAAMLTLALRPDY